jgi:hypothetical protein
MKDTISIEAAYDVIKLLALFAHAMVADEQETAIDNDEWEAIACLLKRVDDAVHEEMNSRGKAA